MAQTTTTTYRLTLERPIGGRMRKAGDTVHLTSAQYAAEARWGGLEPVAGAAPATAAGDGAESPPEDEAPATARRRAKG